MTRKCGRSVVWVALREVIECSGLCAFVIETRKVVRPKNYYNTDEVLMVGEK